MYLTVLTTYLSNPILLKFIMLNFIAFSASIEMIVFFYPWICWRIKQVTYKQLLNSLLTVFVLYFGRWLCSHTYSVSFRTRLSVNLSCFLEHSELNSMLDSFNKILQQKNWGLVQPCRYLKAYIFLWIWKVIDAYFLMKKAMYSMPS